LAVLRVVDGLSNVPEKVFFPEHEARLIVESAGDLVAAGTGRGLPLVFEDSLASLAVEHHRLRPPREHYFVGRVGVGARRL